MVLRRIVACLLLLSVVPLAPLVFASPIDPSYPGGWYDGGDFDDVIDILLTSVCAVELVAPELMRPFIVALGAVDEIAPADPSDASRAPFSGRAPPLA
jgi:hypothetical protein